MVLRIFLAAEFPDGTLPSFGTLGSTKATWIGLWGWNPLLTLGLQARCVLPWDNWQPSLLAPDKAGKQTLISQTRNQWPITAHQIFPFMLVAEHGWQPVVPWTCARFPWGLNP